MSVYGLCSNTPHTIQPLRPSTGVTFQEISTDVGLGPQLSRRSSGEGQGGVKRAMGALDVAYQTWQDLAALWLMGGEH